MNLSRYLAEVDHAMNSLNGLESPPEGAELAVIKAHHASVSTAHKHLLKACRSYRVRTWTRRFIIWGEYEAVTMGYMSFEEIDKS
jgi:hypothetical protein